MCHRASDARGAVVLCYPSRVATERSFVLLAHSESPHIIHSSSSVTTKIIHQSPDCFKPFLFRPEPLKEQTGVMDREYQDHTRFDEWIDEEKHFVARLKNNTKWEVLEELPYDKSSKVFFFARVQLGDENHRVRHPVYLVGFRVGKKIFWVVTDRADLTAAEIAFIYSLRWEIEKLFGWWKRHLKVYHLISRNRHGMLLQLLAGLITYLLLVLYCYQLYGEKPSIRRLRELRRGIRRETGYVVYVMNIHINIEAIALLLLFSIHAIL